MIESDFRNRSPEYKSRVSLWRDVIKLFQENTLKTGATLDEYFLMLESRCVMVDGGGHEYRVRLLVALYSIDDLNGGRKYTIALGNWRNHEPEIVTKSHLLNPAFFRSYAQETADVETHDGQVFFRRVTFAFDEVNHLGFHDPRHMEMHIRSLLQFRQ